MTSTLTDKSPIVVAGSRINPSGEELAHFLISDDAIANYVDRTSLHEVDVEFVREYYHDCGAILRLIEAKNLKEGPTEGNALCADKAQRYKTMSISTMPPLLVQGGYIEDGNHRFRDGVSKGATHFWCYDVLDVEQINDLARADAVSNAAKALLGKSEIPILRFDSVTHIGSLNPEDKGNRGASYEGHGLSVSNCPAAWESICKLGGLPWWRLHKNGALFLDAHGLSDEQRLSIEDWGKQKQLVEAASKWAVKYEDVETGEACSFFCDTEIDANEEALELLGSIVELTQVLVSTAEMEERLGRKVEDGLASDLILVLWAEDCSSLEGVWWSDRLDPEALSAPRGAILPTRLKEWTRQSVDRSLGERDAEVRRPRW